jgi:hypothetical protein
VTIRLATYRETPPQAKQVLCGDCIHHGKQGYVDKMYGPFDVCDLKTQWRTDCVTGEKSRGVVVKCEVRNKGLDCQEFTPIPPKLAWWKLWLGVK